MNSQQTPVLPSPTFEDLLVGLGGFLQPEVPVGVDHMRIRLLLTSDSTPATYFARTGLHHLTRTAETGFSFADLVTLGTKPEHPRLEWFADVLRQTLEHVQPPAWMIFNGVLHVEDFRFLFVFTPPTTYRDLWVGASQPLVTDISATIV